MYRCSNASTIRTPVSYTHLTVVEKYGAAERVHLGKQAGNVGRAVTKLPLMGKSLHKSIERNQVKTAKKLPGPVPALVITAFVARRLLRFRHMLACRLSLIHI